MKKSEYEDAMQQAVKAYPGVDISFTHRGKHKAAELTYRDRTHRIFYPATPSDSKRGVLNKLQDLRRGLRELGAVKA